MKVTISKPNFCATGEYSDGKLIVKEGSTINPSFATYIKGISMAKQYRENPEYVNCEWMVIKDCQFPSPTTAAQFVMGQSRDGYDAWKLESGESLGQHLEARGIRERKRRKKDK